MSKWEYKQLGEYADVQNGYAFKSANYASKGHPIIKIKNVNGRVVNLKECELYPDELCKGLDRFILNNNDILIAMTGAGSVGRVSKFISDNKKKYYLNQRVGIIRTDKDALDNEFLYQLITSNRYEKALYDLASGSGQPNLSPNTIGLLRIPLPPLPTQRRIAAILSSLDDKIENNRKTAEKLEEIAQAIFKRWFVDFEFPNEDGKPYKSSGGEMVYCDELGKEIPEGWECGTLDDIGTIVGGSTPSKKKDEYYINGTIPWITPRDLSNHDGIFISNGENFITEEGYSSCSTKLLPSGSVLFSSRAPIGYIAIATNPVCTNQGFKSIDVNKGYGTEYVYQILKHLIPSIINSASGSTFKEISTTGMKSISLALPLIDLVDKYCDLLKFAYLNIENKENEIISLEGVRDALLPKLMSGEIEV